MKEINVENWEECKLQLRHIVEERAKFSNREGATYVSTLLYRGQSDSRWDLSTTLERYAGSPFKVVDYYRWISAARPQIETFTDLRWDIPQPPDFATALYQEDCLRLLSHNIYEYMAYLRHHAFPSPLLDWTRSPYVAAFFAFKHAAQSQGLVSLYVYLEFAGHSKIGGSDQSNVESFGPYANAHKRHFLQQSEYTVCTSLIDGEYFFNSYKQVINKEADLQDIFWKISVPSSERFVVLSELDSMNINDFSLFGSDESLMATLAFREYDMRRKNAT